MLYLSLLFLFIACPADDVKTSAAGLILMTINFTCGTLAKLDPQKYLCSVSDKTGSGRGDSGGPLTIRGKGYLKEWAYVAGIAVRGERSVSSEKTDEYVRTSGLCEWIKLESQYAVTCVDKPTKEWAEYCTTRHFHKLPLQGRIDDCAKRPDNIFCPQFKPNVIPGGSYNPWRRSGGHDNSTGAPAEEGNGAEKGVERGNGAENAEEQGNGPKRVWQWAMGSKR
ncbi:hypothetical protein DdX_13815 [Ditylenchus destructor]|uniref:Peptidase S1 domain-containing protein n=1 Tax=Ditylenchus destructor TaxID=166010 RepID=A0AAD4MXV5_9BILA|nr:hypothetical protein DdX_13815 [Ditylenchus destructor]